MLQPPFIDQLFRQQRSALIARLTRVLGAKNLDLVESVVQEAFVRAMQVWQDTGVPDQPAAWLLTVAKNRDKQDALVALSRAGEEQPESSAPAAALRGELGEDLLRMMLVACHPALVLEAQLVLVLRTLCGMELTEIARALLTPEPTVAKRLLRGKQKLREVLLDTDFPPPQELPARLDAGRGTFSRAGRA